MIETISENSVGALSFEHAWAFFTLHHELSGALAIRSQRSLRTRALSPLAPNQTRSSCNVCLHPVTRCSIPRYPYAAHRV